MPRGLNKVILIGNLGDEPVIRKTNTGNTVANFSIVTNEIRRNLQTGENTEYAEWHRIVLWNKLAEVAEQYLHKGSRIYLEGKIRNRSYMDKNNQKRYVTEIQAEELLLLDSRPDGAENVPSRPYTNAAAATTSNYGSNTTPNDPYVPQPLETNSYGQELRTQEPSSANKPNAQVSTPLVEPATLPDDQIPF